MEYFKLEVEKGRIRIGEERRIGAAGIAYKFRNTKSNSGIFHTTIGNYFVTLLETKIHDQLSICVLFIERGRKGNVSLTLQFYLLFFDIVEYAKDGFF